MKAIEETPLPAALGMVRMLEQGGKWRVVKLRMPEREG